MITAGPKGNWHRPALQKTDQQTVHGSERQTELEQGRTRNMKTGRRVRQAGMLFVTDRVQLVKHVLPRKLLKGLETQKLEGKQFAESEEGHVVGTLCLRQPFSGALKVRISCRC